MSEKEDGTISGPNRPAALALLQEMVGLCAVGDIDENNGHEGWASLVRDAKELLASAHSAAPAPQPEPPTSSAIALALIRPECARLREWAAIGPVQRAALESFADAMAAALSVQAEPGFVLVRAYSECGKFADDNPGLRADCADKLRRGRPCERCPSRAAPQPEPVNASEQRRGMQALMARLAGLLDEDQFAECENIVRRAGVEPAPRPVNAQMLTEGQIEDCIDAANRAFNGRRQGPRGQMMTTYDDWKHWLAREVERAAIAAAEAAQPEPAAPAAKVPEWIGLTKGEQSEAVDLICKYGTEFVSPLFAVIESVDRTLERKNTKPGAMSPMLRAYLKQQVAKEMAPMYAAFAPTPPEAAQPEPAAVPADKWEGAEEWMPLAWELCADESGEEACEELVWEGGPIPEPWGARWLKYEHEAKRLIALVRKHVPAPTPQPAPAGAVYALRPIIEKFPELNPSNYDHDDACKLNAWGVELVLAWHTALAAADAVLSTPVQAVPPGLRRAAEFTREDLGQKGTNYPHVRELLAFAEQALGIAGDKHG